MNRRAVRVGCTKGSTGPTTGATSSQLQAMAAMLESRLVAQVYKRSQNSGYLCKLSDFNFYQLIFFSKKHSGSQMSNKCVLDSGCRKQVFMSGLQWKYRVGKEEIQFTTIYIVLLCNRFIILYTNNT